MGKDSFIRDVVRSDLHQSEEREMRIKRLRNEIKKGFISGKAKDFDFAKFLQEKRPALS